MREGLGQARGKPQHLNPAWDKTSSDMSRYRLSPAEQLRRVRARMPRVHHREARGQHAVAGEACDGYTW